MKNIVDRKHGSAFTLLELLTVIASLAVLGTVAIAFITNSTSALKKSQLEQDVARLNTAVQVYTSNGGSLDGITTAQEVIDELKKVADASGQKQAVGLRGRMVDNRLHAEEETGGEVRPRAVWKDELGRFVIEDTADGVREFSMAEALAPVDYGDAERETKLAYNESDGWIWDSSDYEHSTNTGPSTVPTLNVPTLGAGGGTFPASTQQLGTPIISPGGGVHALSTFPLLVTIEKQSTDPADARIIYSTAPSVWAVYSQPFLVEPGTSVHAYSSNEDPAWEDSDPATATYVTDPEALEIAIYTSKNPVSYVDVGGQIEPGDYPAIETVDPITVTLPGGYSIPDIYENSDQFQFHWTYDGSDPRSSNTRTTGIKFTNGYRNNNGHGNNEDGVDMSNPGNSGFEDSDSTVDDELKPHDKIDYTMVHWDGATLLPIKVVAQSKNPKLAVDSAVLSSNIAISRIDLQAPVISYADDPRRGDTIEIAKLVDFGDMPVGARIYYTTDGTDPAHDGNGNPLTGTLYTGSFDPLLNEDEFTGEAMIVARVYPPQEYAHWFNVSTPSSSFYLVPTWEISGVATGLLSEEINSDTGSYFDWGDPASSDGATFEDISAGERFQIGQLSYYNGGGSVIGDAGSVEFSVEFGLDTTVQQFDYSIQVFTTLNDGSDWENADFVWFIDTQSAQTISLYGTDYSLNLEFGETTSNSTATIEQLQVLEGETATANLYATLVSVGSWW